VEIWQFIFTKVAWEHTLSAVGSTYRILLEIYSGVTAPKIIEIGWHSTKLFQNRKGAVFLRHSIVSIQRRAVCAQIKVALKLTFAQLYIDMSPVTLTNGSVIVSSVFTLQSHINISVYTPSLLSNLFDVFLDARFIVDNSSIGMSHSFIAASLPRHKTTLCSEKKHPLLFSYNF